MQTMSYLGRTWTYSWDDPALYPNDLLSVAVPTGLQWQYHYTNFFGDYSGVTKESLRGRENDWNDPGVVIDGIDINTGQPNTINVTAEQYFQNIFPVTEPYIYDASYVKLRELRFGMDLPASWASRFNARAVSVAITGRNLHTWTSVPNIDPEFSYTIGNFQGVEFGALPNTRSWGISFRVTP